jgi:sensor domain CHASE-containing protein
MIKKSILISWLLALLLVGFSCQYIQEDLTNRVRKAITEQVSKIDSTLVDKIDNRVEDVDSLLKQPKVKTIQTQLEQKINRADSLINNFTKRVGNEKE